MQLSVIIVSYNTSDLTIKTVTSINKSIQKNSSLLHNYEIIVVDNNSHDDTLIKLKTLKLNNLKIIANKKNLGFGGGNNLGFKSATGQYILFLNSDTIVQEGSLEQLVDYYAKHRKGKRQIGLLAAQLINTDGSYQPQGGDTPNLFTIFNTMFFIDDLPLLRKFIPSVQHTGRRFNANEIDSQDFILKKWVGGTAVMIQRELLEDYGGWDENIFMYGEDQELSQRLTLRHYYHGILTKSHITHLGSASSSSRNAICGELLGYFYFFKLYKPAGQLIYLKALLWFAAVLRIFVFTMIKPDKKRAAIYTEALESIEAYKI